jgi:V/A-type H+-transporting ATPase subunit D
MELTRQRKKLTTAVRGHKLLKDKRDELMRRFLEMIYECEELRKKVEASLEESRRSFIAARAEMSDEAVNAALAAPRHETEIAASTQNVMSVSVPKLRLVSYNDIPSYGYAFTTAALDSAAVELRSIIPDMLRLAELEHSCRMMADELEKTRRRVNALEHVTIPESQENIKYITMKLSENERANQARLMKVKDMMIAEQYSKK